MSKPDTKNVNHKTNTPHINLATVTIGLSTKCVKWN